MHQTARLARSALITALALLCAEPAAAQTVPAEWVQTARAAWPGSPCAGRETIRVVPAPVRPDSDAIGYAYPDTCTVDILDQIAATRLGCYVLVHEFGHLAGHDHTDESTIMGPRVGDTAPYLQHTIPGCEQPDSETAWRSVTKVARDYAPATGLTDMACRWVIVPTAATCTVTWIDTISRVAFRAVLRITLAADDRYEARAGRVVTRRLRRGDLTAARARGVVRSAPSALTRDPTSAAAARAGRAAD